MYQNLAQSSIGVLICGKLETNIALQLLLAPGKGSLVAMHLLLVAMPLLLVVMRVLKLWGVTSSPCQEFHILLLLAPCCGKQSACITVYIYIYIKSSS